MKTMLMNGNYSFGPHAKERAIETGVKREKLTEAVLVALTGTEEVGANPTGPVTVFRKVLKNGRELRMIVAKNMYEENKAFIVTMYVTDEGDNSIGQRSYKFN